MLPSAICVRLNEQVHSIPFDQLELFTFLDLIRHIKLAFKDIQVSSYDIVMDDQYTIYDNQTLQKALKQAVTTNTTPDIALLLKSNHSHYNVVPIIKPTVLRWTPMNKYNGQNHRYSSSQTLGKRTSTEQQQQEQQQGPSISSSQADGSSTRKDSGISMDEPTTAKKQRVMSADQQTTSSLASRRLAYLSPPQTHIMHSNIRPSSPSPSSSSSSSHSSVHPLEIRRPSTAPSSPSYSRHSSNLSPTMIKLPALLSITSSTPFDNNAALHRHPKLAPLQQDAQGQKCKLPGIISPHPSTTMLRTHSTGSASLSSSTPRYSAQQHEPHSIQYYQHRQPSQQKQSGQFLCEQVVNPFSGRICGQTFRRSYDLSRHQTIHLKNRPFCYCDQCGKKFTRMDALRRHERVQGHTSKQRLLQSPGSPSSPSPSSDRPNNPRYSNPTTTPAIPPLPPLPPPSSTHAVPFLTQQARV